MRRLRLPIRALTVVALAGSGIAGTVLAVSSPASATKAPVLGTCAGSVASTNLSTVTSGGSINALLTGCSGGKGGATGVEETTVASDTGGTATILWTNKKTTTLTYTDTAAASAASCPTFLGQAASAEEVVTSTPTGGNAKITAVGTANVCVYIGTDDTIYESQLGSGSI